MPIKYDNQGQNEYITSKDTAKQQFREAEQKRDKIKKYDFFRDRDDISKSHKKIKANDSGIIAATQENQEIIKANTYEFGPRKRIFEKELNYDYFF